MDRIGSLLDKSGAAALYPATCFRSAACDSSFRPKDPPRKPNYISVDERGSLFLNMKPMDLAGLYQNLVELRVKDPDLSVIVRGDSAARTPAGSCTF